MRFQALASTVALATAFLAFSAAAEETHTIVPKFPDAFSSRTVSVSDEVEEDEEGRTTTHTRGVILADVKKTAQGYTGAYRFESMEHSSLGPDGKPDEDDAMMQYLAKNVQGLTATVTLDENLIPLRVENLDEIKAKATAILTAVARESGEGPAAAQTAIDALFAGMTPESAAELVKQGGDTNSYFNRPFVIGQAVEIPGDPMNLMGASLTVDSTVTLREWQAGKVARFTHVMAPTEVEMRGFMADLLKAFMGIDGPQDKETLDMVQRMAENMELSMLMTCEVEVSLVNYVDLHSDCRTAMTLHMDLKKLLPPEMLADSPELAADLPTLNYMSTSHDVSDRTLVK